MKLLFFEQNTNSLMVKAVLYLLTITLSYNTSHAQKPTREEKKLLKKSRKALSNEKYAEAQNLYIDLLKLNPKNDTYNFETGLSYYFSSFERTKSVPYFEAALQNSKEDTISELLYYLGKAYHLNYQFEESKKTLDDFKKFIETRSRPGKYLLKETEKNIVLSENGLTYSKEKNNSIELKNLGNSINTTDREYAPVFREEDKVILFTSRRKKSKGKTARDLLPYEDIYVAKQVDENNWSIVDNKDELNKYLPNGYNTKKHDAGIIYSADGLTLYTYKKDVLWKSEFKDNKWSSLEKLSKNINDSKFNVPSISVTQDGKTMFFVATKKEGIGGKDIYSSIMDENGNWSAPELLNTINTEEDEDGPFLSVDGKTLYFSSKGHNGMGGYDIYKSEIVDGNFSTPVNMGLPLNSPFDDIYLVIDKEDEIGFFSSDRDGGFGSMDLYGFDLSCPNIENTEIRGIVYNKNNHQPLSSKVALVDSETNTLVNEANTSNHGKFLLVAPPEKSYKLTIEANGYEKQTVNINVPKQCEYYPLFTEISLEMIEKGENNYQVATVRNSFYNTDKELTDSKKATIDTSGITKEVPLTNTGDNDNFNKEKFLLAYSRTIDTSGNDLAYSIITDTVKIDKPIVDSSAVNYQKLFAYNETEIEASNSEYLSFIDKVIHKINVLGKAEVTIESSASKVPTTTYKSNINLTSLRGDKAKEVLMKTLAEKGIDGSKVDFKGINSVIGGPNYTGDYKNTEKYKAYQYIKITVK